jgi:hypothetical protein
MQHPLVGVISPEHQAVFPPCGGKANSIAGEIISATGGGWQHFLDSERFVFIICARFAAEKGPNEFYYDKHSEYSSA